MFFYSCNVNKETGILEFKKIFDSADINKVSGEFIVEYYDSSIAIFKYVSQYNHSLKYISPSKNVADTIILDNSKYPLDNINFSFNDSTYSYLNLKVLNNFMFIYELKDSEYDYLVFESSSIGVSGRGTNIREFVVFIIKDTSIIDKIILSSWFGDSFNFVKSKSNRLEFIKIEPLNAESTFDMNVYNLNLIDVLNLSDVDLKYKVIEIYNVNKNAYDYEYFKY